MNVNTFSKYLLALLSCLLILSYILTYILWIKHKARGLILGLVISAVVSIFSIHYLYRVEVYDGKGNSKTIADIFGDMIGVTFILVSIVIIIAIIGWIIGIYLVRSQGLNPVLACVAPILITGTLVGSLYLNNTCPTHIKN